MQDIMTHVFAYLGSGVYLDLFKPDRPAAGCHWKDMATSLPASVGGGALSCSMHLRAVPVFDCTALRFTSLLGDLICPKLASCAFLRNA